MFKIIAFALSFIAGLLTYNILKTNDPPKEGDSSIQKHLSQTAQKSSFTGKRQSAPSSTKSYETADAALSHPSTNKALINLSAHIKTLNTDQLLHELSLYSRQRKYDGFDSTAYDMIFDQLVNTDIEKAIAVYEKKKKGTHSYTPGLDSHLFKAWLNKDFNAALAYYEKNNNPSVNSLDVDHLIFAKKLEQDPKATLMELSQKNEYFSINHFFDQFVLKQTPEETMHIISELSINEKVKSNLLEAMARQWAAKDWDKTLQWLNTLPENERKGAQSAALSAFASKNPKEAMKMLEENHAQYKSFFEDTRISDLTYTLAIDDPIGTKKWLLKNAPNNPLGIEKVVTVLCATDPNAAKALVDELPEGNAKNKAIENLVQYNETLSPKDKIEYLVNAKKDNLHYQFKIQELLKTWDKKDPVAVDQWIDQSSFTPDQKAKFKEEVSERNSMIYTTVGN